MAIHPAGVETGEKVVTGAREKAELQARSMINTWLKQKAAHEA